MVLKCPKCLENITKLSKNGIDYICENRECPGYSRNQPNEASIQVVKLFNERLEYAETTPNYNCPICSNILDDGIKQFIHDKTAYIKEGLVSPRLRGVQVHYIEDYELFCPKCKKYFDKYSIETHFKVKENEKCIKSLEKQVKKLKRDLKVAKTITIETPEKREVELIT